MNYISSRYNIFVENKELSYMIYNTRTGKYIKIKSDKRTSFEKIFMQKERNQYIESYLIENGFWVKDTDDEYEMAKTSKYNLNTFYVTIMPTMLCDFRCPYCFEEHCNERMTTNVQENSIRYISQEAKKYKHLSIHWYGGEPLLEMQTIHNLSKRLKQLSYELKIPFTASITTNGYNLTWNNYLRLKECNVRQFTVTIDGLPEFHNKTRIHKNGSPTFDTIINNLKEIQTKEHSTFLKIIIRTNYTNESIVKKKEWEKYLYDNFLFDNRFVYLPRYAWDNQKGNFAGKYIDFTYNDNITPIDGLDLNNISNSKISENMLSFSKKRINELYLGADICLAGYNNSIIITPNGLLKKCQVQLDNPYNIVGKLNDDIPPTIFHENVDFWENRDSHKTNCEYCEVFPFCKSKGCAAKTAAINNIKANWCDGFRYEVYRNLQIINSDSLYSDIEKSL